MRAVALLLAVLSSPALAAPVPQPPRGRALEYEAAQRAFIMRGRVQPELELLERWQYEGRGPQRSLMLGSYARVEKRLKLGAFWRVQQGTRVDDDWIRAPDGSWGWRDSSRRTEHVLVLDATPRVELGFLPGRWVGSLKARFERNYTDGRNLLVLEPELAWFWMDGLRPRATVFLRHGADLGLNFGDKTVWRRWWYAAGLWHARPWLAAGPQVALRDEVWSASSEFRSRTGGDSYRVLYRSVVVGGALVARWR